MLIIQDSFLKQAPLTEGGEGIIYNYQDKILKVYKSVVNKSEKLKKITGLINKSLPNTVVKPLEAAYNERKQFIGYIMDKVDGEELKRLSNKKFVKSNSISVKDILGILEKVKNTLIELHKNNVFVGDLNDCNILFDKNNNIHFIDVDSWSVDDINCSVCMETFKDPLLVGDKFSADTDSFAYGIIVFKSLTKIHPFGGTTNPDVSIVDRMKNKTSVIENKNVTIPRTVDGWSFIYPKLIEEMKEIFDKNKRYIIEGSLDQFKNNLKLCSTHNDYYYSKFNECPVCNDNAKLVEAPVKATSTSGIPYILLFHEQLVSTIISQHIYLNDSGHLVHINSKKQVKADRSVRNYFSNDGNIIFSTNDTEIYVNFNGSNFNFSKQYKSRIIVLNDTLYYTNLSNNLVEVIIGNSGNSTKTIAKVSTNSLFEIYNKEHYFICNQYDGMKIINIDGFNYSLTEGFKIQEYGIHFDVVSNRWLFISEDDKGIFRTYVFEKNKLIYFNDTIKYTNELGSICFNSNLIFKSSDKVIKAFSFDKNVYKDFGCDIVNDGSKLLREGNKFIVINEKEIYKVG